MKQAWIDVIREMRGDGYAVIVWTPDEMGDANPHWVEDCSISYGHEYLIPVKDVTEEKANENK